MHYYFEGCRKIQKTRKGFFGLFEIKKIVFVTKHLYKYIASGGLGDTFSNTAIQKTKNTVNGLKEGCQTFTLSIITLDTF